MRSHWMDQLYGEIENARVFDYHNHHLNTHIVNVDMINLAYIVAFSTQTLKDLQQISRMITTNNIYSTSYLNTSKIDLLKKNLCPLQTTMFV